MAGRGSIFDVFAPDYLPVEDLRQSARSMARRHERAVRGLKGRLDDLEDWLGELALLNQSMLRLLLAKGILSRETLAKALKEIDLIDGVEDGRVTRRKPEAEPKAPKKKGRRAGRKKP